MNSNTPLGLELLSRKIPQELFVLEPDEQLAEQHSDYLYFPHYL